MAVDASGLAAPHAGPGTGHPVRVLAAAMLPGLVAIWVFSGGFVLIEPAPYEALFLLVLGAAFLGGMWLYRGTLGLFLLLVVFLPFAVIAAFQARHFELKDTFIYLCITVYLWLTAYVTANFVADDPGRHTALIVRAYTAVAVLSALVGTLAYLGLMPFEEYFLRYGRAKAAFEDPNVFAPFLVLPAVFAAQALFLQRGRAAVLAALVLVILITGVFVSFSRGAWGHLFASGVLSFGLIFFIEARARDKVRMLLLALVGGAGLVVLIAALLSIDNVRELFLERFTLTENYDTGTTGRFGRQSYAFDLALSNPWGIGAKEFTALRIVEEPHNTYVNVLLVYGWGGGLAYIAMIGMTLWRALSRLATRSPSRIALIALVATYIPLITEAAIIDTDHWRHFFLITGLIWGVTAGYGGVAARRSSGASAQPAAFS
ncbi:MAG: O-antigen ligase family protein [Alphaproteobacteria bacterium]|nr:O-antigen ligase family protein [Alphaproteobacteria bacterium]